MNRGEIRQEVADRGFAHITPTSRIDRWINLAYQRLCDREPWPFLETTTSGTAPLTISDVRAVLSVIDETNDNIITNEDRRIIRAFDPTLAATGTAESWYLDDTDLTVYPADTSSTFNVLYLKVPAEFDDDTDEPVLPTRWHYVLVDMAVLEAYKDTDNFEAYSNLRPLVEEDIERMKAALLVPNYDSAPVMIRTDYSD